MNQMANHAYASIRDFGDLLDYQRDREAGPTVLSSTRFCEILGIDTDLLAELARVPGSAAGPVSAWEGVQCFIRATLRVLHADSDMNGDMNRPGFSRRSRASESIAFQTLPARARCSNHADASRCRTSLCSRIRRPAHQPASDRSCA